MLSWVTPDLRLESVLDLPLARVRELGLRALFLDIDCTLKDYRATGFRREVVDWVESLRMGDIHLRLFSNGQPRRVAALAQQLRLPFIAQALKPLPFRCRRELRRFELRCAETAVVGDQLFADVLAGRLAGLMTILVAPTSADEPWFTRLKRPFERRVLALLERRSAAKSGGSGVAPVPRCTRASGPCH